MSSEDILDNEQIFDDLFSNKLYIAFIVHESQCYWVIDWDEHFNLDYSKHIEAVCNKPSSMMHLPKGLSVEQYRSNLYKNYSCLLYTSPSPRDGLLSRMPSSA